MKYFCLYNFHKKSIFRNQPIINFWLILFISFVETKMSTDDYDYDEFDDDDEKDYDYDDDDWY